MPRRRATKLGTRAKPKLPAGDQGEDMSQETRRSKLEALLKDFDMEVESRLSQMEREAKYLCKAIQKTVNMEIFKMHKSIKKMTVQEFHKSGGSYNQKALQDYSKQVESLAYGLCSNSEASQSETEDSEAPAQTSKKPTKRGRPKKATATATRTSQRTTRTRRTTAKTQFETPAANTGRNGLLNAGLDTPMVTPKFDPRLPLTPAAMREATRGETIMSMSGSPINNPSRLDCNKPGLLTLGNGKVIDVQEEDTTENLAMDETTRKNIMMLQDYLGKILQHSTENS